MKRIAQLALIVAISSLIAAMAILSPASAATCPEFSPELDRAVWMAHAVGDPHERGHTLAAIVWRESGGVVPYVIRINPGDGDHGSYGVTHMQLTTAMQLVGETNVWAAKDWLAPRLMEDDAFALGLSVRYLEQHADRDWHGQVAKWRGAGPLAEEYADDVTARANRLQACNYFADA